MMSSIFYASKSQDVSRIECIDRRLSAYIYMVSHVREIWATLSIPWRWFR